MSNEFEDLKEVINADLAAENTEKKSIDFEGIAKMSKANLAKQDKNILLAFAEEKNLLKDLTERQKKRLTRKELADLIKPTVKRENKSAQDTNAQESINEFAIYQEAIKSALNGDYSTIDSLAQNNVMGFVNDSLNSGEETSEKMQKIIAVSKIVISAFYLVMRFTGGVAIWAQRVKNVFAKIKNKFSKKKSV